MVAMNVIIPFSVYVADNVLGHKLRKVFLVLGLKNSIIGQISSQSTEFILLIRQRHSYNIIHCLLSNVLVHVLIAVHLQ